MQSHPPSDPSLIEVPVSSLQPGMFVAELDRPWLETPFATQGFVVKDIDDCDYIGKHCTHVYIDSRRAERVGLSEKRFAAKKSQRKVSIKQELGRAKVDFESASDAMAKVFNRIKSNRRINLVSVRQAISPLIDSVFRNAEATAALARLKTKGDYLYQHSLSTAIWATVLGKHLGLEKADLVDLALGVSMMDVGMCELPDDLLAKTRKLTPAEKKAVRDHVKEGLALITAGEELPKRVINIIACHHERYDGSGYPQGLSGNAIPLFARIAGLVDTYDAMITDRPHAPARSSFEAVQELADLKESSFQASLVEHFVQTIGMFPTGSIVELNSGEIGVVVGQNPSRRLRPKIVLVRDADKVRLTRMAVIDLSKYAETRDGLPPQWIVKEHQIASFDINPDDYFL